MASTSRRSARWHWALPAPRRSWHCCSSPRDLNLHYHLVFAPVNEEPLFRGFLWGYLRRLCWREGVTWASQVALFTSAHVYFARQYPLIFWVFIPAAGLLFGWLAWRSRSGGPAMLAHAMVNGSVYLMVATVVSMGGLLW